MKKLKLRAIIAPGAAFVLLVAGCSASVATVNGKAVSAKLYNETLNAALVSYELTAETLAESVGQEQADLFKEDIRENLILQEVMMQKAEEQGFARLTAEEEQGIEQSADEYLQSIMDNMRAEAETAAAGDSTVNMDAVARQNYNDYISREGITRPSLVEQMTTQTVLLKLQNSVMQGYSMTAEDAKIYYDTNLAQLQEQDAADPGAAFQSYVNGEQQVEVYVPAQAAEKARYVKHILVAIPQDQSDAIMEAETAGDAERAEQLRAEALASIKAKADEVQAKAASGDFEALISEYNEDPGMASAPEGYLVYEGAGFVPEFLEASLALQNVGDVTPEPVATDYGYHIIRFASRPEAGALPFDGEMEQRILDAVGPQRQQEYWNSILDEWLEEADIVRGELP